MVYQFLFGGEGGRRFQNLSNCISLPIYESGNILESDKFEPKPPPPPWKINKG